MEQIAISMQEAARHVGVCRQTLYAWARRPGFPLISVNGVKRVHVERFENWLLEQSEEG